MSLTVPEAGEFFDGIAATVESPKVQPALQEWVDKAKSELSSLMNRQQSPNGDAYVPLSPVTIKKKGHSKALFETGKLHESLVSSGDGHIEEVTEDSATLGTGHLKDGKPIAQWMQDGNKRVPARPFVGVNDKMADDAAEAVADLLIEQIANL